MAVSVTSADAEGAGQEPEAGDGPQTEGYTYPSNTLFLEIITVTNNQVSLAIHGTVEDVVYELLSQESLTNGYWVSESLVLGAAGTNVTFTPVALADRTNSLFLWARSWVDADGNGLPDWWELQHFGTAGNDPYGDPDHDGWVNLDEFQNGTNPLGFNTPPAPSGLTVRYNGSSEDVLVTWAASPGAVTGYTVRRVIPELGRTDTWTLPGSVTSLADAPFPLPNPNYRWSAPTYQAQAQYALGNSPWSAQVQLYSQVRGSAAVVRGPGGRSYLVVPPLPEVVTAIRLEHIYRSSPYVYLTNSYDISLNLFTNGVFKIPEAWAPPFQTNEMWYDVYALDANTNARSLLNWYCNYINIPFFDGREQLKDNLVFQLRAANRERPFGFYWHRPDYGSSYFNSHTNYTVASLFSHGYFEPYLPVSDEYAPFLVNRLYRNFVFTPADVDEEGYLTNGFNFYRLSDSWPWIELEDPPKYSFQPPRMLTNFPSLLSAAEAQWTYFFPSYVYHSDPEHLWQDLSAIGCGFIEETDSYYLTDGVRNLYGLPIESAKLAGYWGDGEPAATTTLFAGQSSSPDFWAEYVYPCTAWPQLLTMDYYFVQRPPYRVLVADWMPGSTHFSVTNIAPPLVVPLGESALIAGYAKQRLLNGYPDVYAYLGQYFDKAYLANPDGTRSTNETGVLSEYGEFFPTHAGLNILTTKPDLTQTNNLQGECRVHVIKLQLDVNHDGEMDLSWSGPDNTSQLNPMRFWANNDWDISDPVGDPGHDRPAGPVKDYNDSFIESRRDLEDFARLWICGVPALTQGTYQVTLTWANVSGHPAINLFRSVETNGGIGYLTDTNVAAAQVPLYGGPGTKIATISPSEPFTFPASYFTNTGNKYFLFEGACTNGTGELVLTISQNGTNIAQTGAWLDLHDLKDFYERAVITNSYSGTISNWSSAIQTVQYASASALGDDTNLIVLVHGINVGVWAWYQNSETTFKRLYWSGYRGKFATVKWPCDYLTPPNIWDPAVFNMSEMKAFKAAAAMRTYLTQLRARFSDHGLHILAHSQGNAITSEAISQGAPFDTYILTQGAMPASCYDLNAPTNTDLANREYGVWITPNWQPMGYHGSYTNLTGRIVNFYNPEDGVLAVWLLDQRIVKPSQFYSYDRTNCWYLVDPDIQLYRLVTDTQESRSMIARSRTWPIGMQGPTPPQLTQGVIGSTLNFHTYLGFTDAVSEHSAQFTRPIQTSRPYFQEVLRSCLIPFAP